MAVAAKSWRGWGLAVAAALIVTLLVLVLARAPRGSVARDRETVPGEGWEPVGIAKLHEGAANELLREEALMRDPAPLFLPSQWSASSEVLSAEVWRDPGMTFRGYEPKWVFNENRLAVEMPSPVTAPSRPAEAFALDRPARPFRGFGQEGGEVRPLAKRRAFLAVSSAADGQPRLSLPLTEAELPVADGWEPLEFLLAVNPSGVIRPPVLVDSSSVAAVDSYFQEYLIKALHLGERLGPGFYRVAIGP